AGSRPSWRNSSQKRRLALAGCIVSGITGIVSTGHPSISSSGSVSVWIVTAASAAGSAATEGPVFDFKWLVGRRGRRRRGGRGSRLDVAAGNLVQLGVGQFAAVLRLLGLVALRHVPDLPLPRYRRRMTQRSCD